MPSDTQKIIEYETIIPTCIQALSKVMPELHTIVRDDLVLIYSKDYPSLDINRAFLLRETPEKIDGLIDEVIAYFKDKGLPTTIMVSPACTPADLPQRLLQRGFVRQEPDECWLVYEHLQQTKIPKPDPKFTVVPVDLENVGIFAATMVAAYEMTPDWTPMLTKALEPSIGQPNIRHYITYLHEEPVATMTTLRHKEYIVAGSGGVIPAQRGTSLVYNLSVTVLAQAQKEGVDTILGQTTVGPMFERFLRIYGFKQAFKRQGYILE
jgi:hypothetical protein